MRAFTIVALFLVVAFAHDVRSDDVADLRKKYLSDPAVSAEIKRAIEKGVVIPGMCPFQAFAAVGLPGFYQVTPDTKKWRMDIPPPVIINAQCDKPDDSRIWLTFRSKTQFGTREPIVFFVRFEKGRAVEVTRKHEFKPGET
jgi:hypothetical protein